MALGPHEFGPQLGCVWLSVPVVVVLVGVASAPTSSFPCHFAPLPNHRRHLHFGQPGMRSVWHPLQVPHCCVCPPLLPSSLLVLALWSGALWGWLCVSRLGAVGVGSCSSILRVHWRPRMYPSLGGSWVVHLDLPGPCWSIGLIIMMASLSRA